MPESVFASKYGMNGTDSNRLLHSKKYSCRFDVFTECFGRASKKDLGYS